MKIIDILVAKANGTLEDGFKFKYGNKTFRYYKKQNVISNNIIRYNITDTCFGDLYRLDNCLNDEVELIEENKEIEELLELPSKGIYSPVINENRNKINELVREVNKLIKEREEK